MTASLHRLPAGAEAGAYYTDDATRGAKPRNRDEYYARDGAGTLWSTGETVVRHGASIDRRSFRALCAGLPPGTGAPLVRGAGPGYWAGLDLTFTPGKSGSLLWAAGTAEQRAAIEAAHRGAVEAGLGFVEREGLVLVRSGAGGKRKDWPSDLIVARYDHYTRREGDPNIHTHAVVINVAGAEHTSIRGVLCASPDYLRMRGAPDGPGRLDGHDLRLFGERDRIRPWPQPIPAAGARPSRDRARTILDSAEAQRLFALAGLGIAHLPDFLVASGPEEGRLIALPSPAVESIAVHVLYPERCLLPARVRVFIDMLAEELE